LRRPFAGGSDRAGESVHFRRLLNKQRVKVKVKQSLYMLRGLQEVKVPRLHGNCTGWW
jgi:hypothetical protein